LYVLDDGSHVRQLTFLLGQELAPAFKHNGQLIFTTEKRAPGFYQLAARRLNLDGTDYHPLFGQRKTVGFEQLTEVHELADGNLVGVFSDRGALAGGGTLGVINRSLGPDQADRDPNDRQFLHSLTFPDPSATGKLGSAGGAYRSPAPLPSMSMLASWASGADVGTFDGRYVLVQIDTRTGARRVLLDRPGFSIVESGAIYARPDRGVFAAISDNFRIEAGQTDALLRYVDLPLIATLMFENRRVARTVDLDLASLGVLESLPPPPGLTSLDAADPRYVVTDAYGKMWLRRRRLGVASLFDDGSLALRVPGGMPMVYELYETGDRAPHTTQLEEGQLAPGERAKGSFRRELFDGNCGGCHGALSGHELDLHVRPEVLTGASRVKAMETTAKTSDLYLAPGARGPDL
jgi:hypothetical protein